MSDTFHNSLFFLVMLVIRLSNELRFSGMLPSAI